MVMKKPKSKRLTTRHRTKIARKAREHHRKQRKAAQKSGHVTKKTKKDPGIPAIFPLRESFIKRIKDEQLKEKMQKEARKALRASQDVEMDSDGLGCSVDDDSKEELEGIASRAERKDDSFEASRNEDFDSFLLHQSSESRDNSRRAFYREFKSVFDASDVILQVLDARDPNGCRVQEVEEAILASGGKKRLILVLNKIDLVPREILQGWLKYLRREFPAVGFKASVQEGRTGISQNESINAIGSSECVGADTLLQLLKNYARSDPSSSKKTRICVGVVGYPNVGKSSLINSLKRSKVCRVGAAPGVTTAKQEIHLDKNVTLIDCPGIVFAKTGTSNDHSVTLRNCLKVEQLADPTTPALAIIKKVAIDLLQSIYTLPAIADPTDGHVILTLLAKRLGKLRKGGVPDLEGTARHLINDWNGGKIPYATPVPTEREHLVEESTEIVSAWAPEFRLDDLERMEIDEGVYEATCNTTVPLTKPVEPSKCSGEKEEIKHGKEKKEKSSYEFKMSEAERELNPQINRQRQKALKEAAKKASKLANRQKSLCQDNDNDTVMG